MAMIDLEHAAAQAYDLGHQFACICEQIPQRNFKRDDQAQAASNQFYEFLTNDNPHALSVRLAALHVQIREFDKTTSDYLKHQWLYHESQKKKAFDNSSAIGSYHSRSDIVREFEKIEKLYTGGHINTFMSKGGAFERSLKDMNTPEKIITLAQRRIAHIEALAKPPELGSHRVVGKRSAG